MRRLLFACGAVLLLCRPAVAQTGQEPTLILTLFGGASRGHRLWHIDRQPLCTLNTCNNATPDYDTLELTRDISTGIVLGASGTYFRSPHVGIEAELYYLTLPFGDSCRGIYYNPDSVAVDQQVCLNVDAAKLSTSAISLYGGLVFRALPGAAISLYVRAGLGVVTYSGGTTELSGPFEDVNRTVRSRAIIEDPDPRTAAPSFKAAIGFTTRIGSGYQFRLEVQDAIVTLDRVVGSANRLAAAPTASHSYHRLLLTMGLDVVLEKKRGRRY